MRHASPLRSSHFYPRPPRGGRLLVLSVTSTMLYFYPRPPRGGRPIEAAANAGTAKISIHALREEGDFIKLPEGDALPEFLSTPSARRATP